MPSSASTSRLSSHCNPNITITSSNLTPLPNLVPKETVETVLTISSLATTLSSLVEQVQGNAKQNSSTDQEDKDVDESSGLRIKPEEDTIKPSSEVYMNTEMPVPAEIPETEGILEENSNSSTSASCGYSRPVGGGVMVSNQGILSKQICEATNQLNEIQISNRIQYEKLNSEVKYISNQLQDLEQKLRNIRMENSQLRTKNETFSSQIRNKIEEKELFVKKATEEI
jgi:hypothetical protein